MTRQNIALARPGEIPIGLVYSWLLVFSLLTWLLAHTYPSAEFKNGQALLHWFMEG